MFELKSLCRICLNVKKKIRATGAYTIASMLKSPTNKWGFLELNESSI